VDEDAARSRGIEEGGVDGGDFVADFPGAAGALDGEARFAEDGVVGDADAAGFARSTRGVRAGDDAAVDAVAGGYFVGEVPGGRSTREHDFVEDVEGVLGFDGADAGHWVDVEVDAEEKGEDVDVDGVRGDVGVAEADGDEAGEVLERRFEFLAERARIKLSAGGFHFLGWDVPALNRGVAPAAPFVGWVIFAVAPKVVEP